MSNIFEGRLFIFNMNNMIYERRICTCCIAELLSLNLQVYELYNSVLLQDDRNAKFNENSLKELDKIKTNPFIVSLQTNTNPDNDYGILFMKENVNMILYNITHVKNLINSSNGIVLPLCLQLY